SGRAGSQLASSALTLRASAAARSASKKGRASSSLSGSVVVDPRPQSGDAPAAARLYASRLPDTRLGPHGRSHAASARTSRLSSTARFQPADAEAVAAFNAAENDALATALRAGC